MPTSARTLLEQFGGLTVGRSGAGVTCARGSVRIEPDAYGSGPESLAEHSKSAGRQLYPIGETHNRYMMATVDAHGGIYLLGDGGAEFAGPSIYHAFEAILQGRLPWTAGDARA